MSAHTGLGAEFFHPEVFMGNLLVSVQGGGEGFRIGS